MKQSIKKIPFLGNLLIELNKKVHSGKFKNSKKYWKQRYKRGGNSGSGSYNNLAEFKGRVINEFVKKNNIQTVIELGCGDGNQLKYFNFPIYIGFDISSIALKQCKSLYTEDTTKSFYKIKNIKNYKADLVLSLDVIYHLVEDKAFYKYMKQLFDAATTYVIIYSSNFSDDKKYMAHVKHRKFTDWIKENNENFELIKHIPNKFPEKETMERKTSFADFYIYKRLSKNAI